MPLVCLVPLWCCSLPKPASAQTPAGATQPADGPSVNLGTIPVTAPALNPDGSTAASGGMYVPSQSLGPLGDVKVQDLPLTSISVPQALIQDQQAKNLQDILKNVPGVAVSGVGQNSAANANFQIRGFGIGSSGQSIRQDGIPIGSSSPLPAEATERVDVYEGVDALLYGFAEPGGVVNSISKKPRDTPLTRFTESYTNNATFEEAADISRRFGQDDQFGIRVNLATENGNGPIDKYHINRNVADLALDWKPISGLRVWGRVDHSYARYDGQQTGLYLGGDGSIFVPPAPNPTRNYGEPWFYSQYETTVAQTGLEYKDENWHVLASLGIAHILFGLQDSGAQTSGFVGDPASETYANGTNVFGHDRETYGSGSLLIGRRIQTDFITQTLQASYSKTNFGAQLERSTPVPGQATTFDNNLLAPFYVPDPHFLYGPPTLKEGQTYENTLLTDTVDLGSHVTILGGASLGSVKTDTNFPGIVDSHSRQFAVTPLGGVVVKINPRVSVYGSYVQGLQQGSLVGDPAALNYLQVLPAFVSEQIEAGVKAQIRPGLQVTAAAFQIKQALQALDFVSPTAYFVTQNGSQINRGIQATVTGKLTEGLAVFGGFTVLRAIGHHTGDPLSEGLLVAGVPYWTANLAAQYSVPFLPDLMLLASVNHTSDSVLRSSGNKLPGFTTLDLGAAYAMRWFDRPVVARVYVSNATGARYWLPGFGFADPLTARASLQVDF